VKELRVPTRRITVEVYTTDGVRTRGSMFHTESLYETGSAEDIVAELNDERLFVPIRPENGETQSALLSKRHIVRVRVPDLSAVDLRPDETDAAQRAETCTLQLDDGSSLTGRPVVETPASLSRLVDKFNHAPTFITFVSDDGVDFVHGARIARIIPQG
jgi:hypothetical protein